MAKKVYNKRIARVRRKLERRRLPTISKKELKERLEKKLSSNKSKNKE